MCNDKGDRCCCGGAPSEPVKPAEDVKKCDEDKKEQACDTDKTDKKEGGCCG